MPPTGQETLFTELLGRLEQGWRWLPDKPGETPEATLRTLWFRAAGDPRSMERSSEPLPELSEEECEHLANLVEARRSGSPLAYLVGFQSFLDVELISDGNAMVPRPETEILGRTALACLQGLLEVQKEALVLDICTGSGNLATALAVHAPRCQVVGVDLMPGAIELARKNAERNGVAQRVTFREGDLFAPVETEEFVGTVDLVVCNPPYITSARVEALPPEILHHEPRPAFDGGPLGLTIILRVMKEAPRFLRPGAWLCFELGLGQGARLRKLLERNPNYSSVEAVTDEDGAIRVLLAQTPVENVIEVKEEGIDSMINESPDRVLKDD